MTAASFDQAEGAAQLRAAGEHVIFVVFQSYNGAAIPVCWRAEYQEAVAVIRALRADAESRGEKAPLMWTLGVSDVPMVSDVPR